MKIYEALKEMINNGKTIKVPKMNSYYKIGSMDWQKDSVLLRSFSNTQNEWTIAGFSGMADQFFFSDEWSVVTGEKDELD